MNRATLIRFSVIAAFAMVALRPLFPSTGHSWFSAYMAILHIALGIMLAKLQQHWRDKGLRNILLACIIIPSAIQAWWFFS